MEWSDLAFAVVFNCGIAAVCFIIFNILRRTSLVGDFYSAKRKLAIPFRFRPPRLPTSFLGWVKPVFTLPDEQFARCAGLDALTYVRFLNLCLRITFFVAIISFVVLLPVNLTSDNVEKEMAKQANCEPQEETTLAAGEVPDAPADDDCGFIVTDFDKTSLTNIEEKSHKLWAHVIAINLITIVVLMMMWQHYKEAINWRVLHFAWLRKGQEGHTVLVRDVPTPSGKPDGASILPEALQADNTIFEANATDVYKVDTDIAKHINGAEGRGSLGPAPQPLISRTSLKSFQSRPPQTDLDPTQQVKGALEAGIPMKQVVQREFCRTVGADEVEHVSVVYNDSDLVKKMTEYNKAKATVQDTTDAWVGAMRKDEHDKSGQRKAIKRKTVKLGKMMGLLPPDDEVRARYGDDAKTADIMEYNTWRMTTLFTQIEADKQQLMSAATQSAFVTLRSRRAQAQASTGLLSVDVAAWQTDNAPAPKEIIWKNVPIPGSQRGLRKLIGWGILLTIIICFFPIMLGLQQIVNLEAYRDGDNWAAFILDAPLLSSIFKIILPTLALTIILAVMPTLIKVVATKIEGRISASAVDFELGRKYYIFQFFVVFLFGTILGAASSGTGGESDSSFPLIDLFNELKDDPALISTWLGNAIPQQASFFLSFLLTKGIFASSIAFLRAPGAIIFWILQKISPSERAKKRCWARQYASYGKQVPGDTIAFLLMLTFSVSQPFISGVALLYFVMSSFYWRYNLLYCQREAFQSGGLFWPVMFEHMYVAVIVFQLSYIGIIAVKKFPYSVLLVLPLIASIVWRFAISAKFARPFQHLAVHAAADLDRADLKYDWMKELSEAEAQQMKDDGWDLEDVDIGDPSQAYVQPALKLDLAEHNKVLAQAEEAARLTEEFNRGGKVPRQGLLATYNGAGPLVGNFHDVPNDSNRHLDAAENGV